MKNHTTFIVTISLSLIVTTASIAQGWSIQHTFSPAQSLQCIRFYDANTGYTTAPVYGGSMLEVHKTTNGGVNWVDQNAGYTGERFMAIWITSPDTVYISGNDGHILKTVNGGTNWVTLTTNDSVQLWGMQFVNSTTGYAAGSYGHILKTTNAGASWFQLTNPMQNLLSSIYFRNANTGYISGSVIILKSTNAGANWSQLSAAFQNFEDMNQIQFTDDNTGFGVTSAGRLFKSTDAGATWAISTISSNSLMTENFVDGNTGYACGWAGTILRTTDGSATWATQTSPVNEILTSVYFTSPTTGYISTWNGEVLQTTTGGLSFVEKISGSVPENFSLRQNFPNPFNPTTDILFSIAPPLGLPLSGGDAEGVRLTIYDILGREISTLVNEPLSPGTYRVRWNATNYSSGVYFYTLSTGTFRDTKKMVVVK